MAVEPKEPLHMQGRQDVKTLSNKFEMNRLEACCDPQILVLSSTVHPSNILNLVESKDSIQKHSKILQKDAKINKHISLKNHPKFKLM